MFACLCVYVHVCVCVHVYMYVGTGGGKKRLLNPLDLELQVLVSWSFSRNLSIFNNVKPQTFWIYTPRKEDLPSKKVQAGIVWQGS